MNQHPGVIGRKLGMTQIFGEDGTVTACTVVEAASVVIGKRTVEKDGYSALVLGIGERLEKRASKAELGAFKKAGVAPKQTVRELRCSAEYAAAAEVGQPLKLESLFEEGQLVDVQGITRGRGFTGVMRRYNFKGYRMTHGTHEYRRHGGSIGTRMTPGRVKLGMKMPGQYGSEQVSVLNQRVAKLVADQNLVLVAGAIPGARGTLVVVRGAIKRSGGKKKAA
jgi:large subunit ribosomal protein L3